MGVNVSRNLELSENEYLKRFVGKEHIPVTDHKFWDGFLQYHIILPTNRYIQIHSITHAYVFFLFFAKFIEINIYFFLQSRTAKFRFTIRIFVSEFY